LSVSFVGFQRAQVIIVVFAVMERFIMIMLLMTNSASGAMQFCDTNVSTIRPANVTRGQKTGRAGALPAYVKCP